MKEREFNPRNLLYDRRVYPQDFLYDLVVYRTQIGTTRGKQAVRHPSHEDARVELKHKLHRLEYAIRINKDFYSWMEVKDEDDGSEDEDVEIDEDDESQDEDIEIEEDNENQARNIEMNDDRKNENCKIEEDDNEMKILKKLARLVVDTSVVGLRNSWPLNAMVE